MMTFSQQILTQYQEAARILNTTVDRLVAQDALGPMCESGNRICTCVEHKCGWFTRCYPQYKNTAAKEWEYKEA